MKDNVIELTREQINSLSEAEFHARDLAIAESACDIRKMESDSLYPLLSYSSQDFKDGDRNVHVNFMVIKDTVNNDKKYCFMLVYTFDEEDNSRELVYVEDEDSTEDDAKNADEIINHYYSEFDWLELYDNVSNE